MMNKQDLNRKLKEGISPQQIENFAKKYTQEVFSNLAIFIAFISCLFNFFSGADLSILFVSFGAIIGIAFANKIQNQIQEAYIFLVNQEKNVEMLLGAVKIIIALFLPFLFFGFLGVLSGLFYRNLMKNAHNHEQDKIDQL